MYACEPASFWGENVVAVVSLLTSFCESVEVAETSYHVLISINTDNSSNFSGAKKVQWSFPGCLFFRIREKTLIQISSSNLKFSTLNPLRLWRSRRCRCGRRDILNPLFSDSSFQKYIPYNKTFHGWPVTDWWISVGSTEVDLAH